jgi:hypothetical protein
MGSLGEALCRTLALLSIFFFYFPSLKKRYMKAYPALFSAVSCGLTQRRWSVFAEEQSRAGLDPEAYQDGKDHSISDLS